MNKKIDVKLGVVIIVIFTITVGAFAWIYGKKQLKTIQQNQIVNEAQQKNQIQKPEIFNPPIEIGLQNQNIQTDTWKTYTNSRDGYSIKYPYEWIFNSKYGSEEGLIIYTKELLRPGQLYPRFGNVLSDNLANLKDISGDYFISISVYKKMGTHVNLKEWRKYDGGNYKELLIKENPALKFDKKPYTNQDNKDIAGSLRYYFINNKNDGYEITIWYKDSSNGIGEKIISTLYFSN